MTAAVSLLAHVRLDGGHVNVPKIVQVSKWTAPYLFALDMIYFAALVALLVGRPAHFLLVDKILNPIGGVIPVGVPWFGALGATTLSIYGVFDHNTEWDTSWN